MITELEHDWKRIIAAEPRVAGLLTTGCAVVMVGETYGEFPDPVYSDIKPYLRFLIGWTRLHGTVIPRCAPPTPHDARLAAVIAQPATPTTETEEAFLRSQGAFDTACQWMYSELCRVHKDSR